MKRTAASSQYRDESHASHCRDLPTAQRWCARLAIAFTVVGGLADLYMRGHL